MAAKRTDRLEFASGGVRAAGAGPSGHKPFENGGRTCAPVAALLFDCAARPSSADLRDLASAHSLFGVTHDDADAGHIELMRDGLTFDCLGLAPATGLRMDSAPQQVDLPAGFDAGAYALVTLGPGPHLAGAAQLLPVVRGLAGLVLALSELPGVAGVIWLPARLAMSAAWFSGAVGRWLQGGPFPALALTALARSDQGFASRGLSFFVGQEFVFAGKDGMLREADLRGAVRLTDWLVAHGRVDSPRQVDLAGFGKVHLEPDGQNILNARGL